jgi:hypothetical protein
MGETGSFETKEMNNREAKSRKNIRKLAIDCPVHWQYTTDEALRRLVPEGFGRTLVITKEVLDNAADAAEKLGGFITVDLRRKSLLVINRGLLTMKDIETLTDFSVLRTEKYSQRAFIRGQIGHGLKLAIMLALAEGTDVKITSGGYHHVLSLSDRYSDDPRKVVSLKSGSVSDMDITTIELPLPDDEEERARAAHYVRKYAVLNPHIGFMIDGQLCSVESDLRKNTRADIHSYDLEEFERLAQGYLSRGVSVRDFLLLFNVPKRRLPLIHRKSATPKEMYGHLKIFARKVPLPAIGRGGFERRVRAVLGYELAGYKKIDLDYGGVEIVVFNGNCAEIVASVNGSCLGENEFWLAKGGFNTTLSSIVSDLKITKPVLLSYYSTRPLLKDSNKQTVLITDGCIYETLKRLYRSSFPTAPSTTWMKKKSGYARRSSEDIQTRNEARTLKIRPVTYCFLAECKKIADEMYGKYGPITIRQLYYQLVSRGTIENSAGSYNNYVNHMKTAREIGLIEYDRFEDRSRYAIFERPASLDVSPDEFIRSMLKGGLSLPPLDLWHNQPCYVELWIEKDALVTLFGPVARKWQVMLFPSRGYTSLTKIQEARIRFDEMRRKGRKVIVLYAGDLDPSGWGIYENIDNKLSAGGSVVVRRIALNPDQADNLYPMPLKESDTRYNQFLREHPALAGAYELDAMDPAALQQITSQSISRYFDDTLVPWQLRSNWEEEFTMLKKNIFCKIRLD